jgi:hypothetical protein
MIAIATGVILHPFQNGLLTRFGTIRRPPFLMKKLGLGLSDNLANQITLYLSHGPSRQRFTLDQSSDPQGTGTLNRLFHIVNPKQKVFIFSILIIKPAHSLLLYALSSLIVYRYLTPKKT